MKRTRVFLVPVAIQGKNNAKLRKYTHKSKIVALKRFMSEIYFTEYHFYIRPNFDSNICEQKKVILN